jgi:hypothetical protein
MFFMRQEEGEIFSPTGPASNSKRECVQTSQPGKFII